MESGYSSDRLEVGTRGEFMFNVEDRQTYVEIQDT